MLAARDAGTSLDRLERENPDLIILDMMMPKKSGFLVLEKLRSRPAGLIPTIMMQATRKPPSRLTPGNAQVRDYIRKPFALESSITGLSGSWVSLASRKTNDLPRSAGRSPARKSDSRLSETPVN